MEFIRRFEEDYGPRPEHLVENYRSTGHIIEASNAVIEPARERMKAEHPIRINAARAKGAPGGAWQELDPVGRGRVQILPAPRDPVAQARIVMAELQRLSTLAPDWDWSKCAVIAREWKYLALGARILRDLWDSRHRWVTRISQASGGCARPGT